MTSALSAACLTSDKFVSAFERIEVEYSISDIRQESPVHLKASASSAAYLTSSDNFVSVSDRIEVECSISNIVNSSVHSVVSTSSAASDIVNSSMYLTHQRWMQHLTISSNSSSSSRSSHISSHSHTDRLMHVNRQSFNFSILFSSFFFRAHQSTLYEENYTRRIQEKLKASRDELQRMKYETWEYDEMSYDQDEISCYD
jgi:hypothetical protein